MKYLYLFENDDRLYYVKKNILYNYTAHVQVPITYLAKTNMVRRVPLINRSLAHACFSD